MGACIIFLIFTILNFSFFNNNFHFSGNAKAKRAEIIPGGNIWDHIAAGKPIDAATFDYHAVAPKYADYKAALKNKDWYKYNRTFIPIVGYNESKKVLVPFNITGKMAEKPWAFPENSILLASSRDAMVQASDDTQDQIKTLEERIRKLENTVSRIVSKCCEEA